MRFNLLSPEEILEPKFLADYHKGMDLLHDEILLVNSNLFILHELRNFRFDLFVLPQHFTLLAIVWRSLERTAAVGLCKLATDQDPRTLTLDRMAREVRNNSLLKHRTEISAHLKKAAPNADARVVLKRIKELRDKRLAHLDPSFSLADWIRAAQVPLNELEDARRVVTGYFQALSFGHGRAELPLEYLSVRESADDTDIRRLLNGIARDSVLLNMPEKQPKYWMTHWREYPAKDIDLINHHRRKANLKACVPGKEDPLECD